MQLFNYSSKTSRVIRREKQWPSKSTGRICIFVDSDDVIYEGFIEKALNSAVRNKLDVFLFSFENFCDDFETFEVYKDRISRIKKKYAIESIASGIEQMRFSFEHEEYYPMVWLQIVRRRILVDNSIDFYRGIVFEDVLYTFKLLWNAQRVMGSTKIGYRKRLHNESICGRPENIGNAESLWVNYKEIIALCERLNPVSDEEEYVVKCIIEKTRKQFLLHYDRLNAVDKECFRSGLSRWDRVRIDLL